MTYFWRIHQRTLEVNASKVDWHCHLHPGRSAGRLHQFGLKIMGVRTCEHKKMDHCEDSSRPIMLWFLAQTLICYQAGVAGSLSWLVGPLNLFLMHGCEWGLFPLRWRGVEGEGDGGCEKPSFCRFCITIANVNLVSDIKTWGSCQCALNVFKVWDLLDVNWLWRLLVVALCSGRKEGWRPSFPAVNNQGHEEEMAYRRVGNQV